MVGEEGKRWWKAGGRCIQIKEKENKIDEEQAKNRVKEGEKERETY